MKPQYVCYSRLGSSLSVIPSALREAFACNSFDLKFKFETREKNVVHRAVFDWIWSSKWSENKISCRVGSSHFNQYLAADKVTQRFKSLFKGSFLNSPVPLLDLLVLSWQLKRHSICPQKSNSRTSNAAQLNIRKETRPMNYRGFLEIASHFSFSGPTVQPQLQ